MRSLTRNAAAAGIVGGLLLLSAGPAAAAGAPAAGPGAPDDRAVCLATVFQAQAVAGPRTVSDRILEIKEFLLGDDQFGQAIQVLLRYSC
jgi:hypothetical protein